MGATRVVAGSTVYVSSTVERVSPSDEDVPVLPPSAAQSRAELVGQIPSCARDAYETASSVGFWAACTEDYLVPRFSFETRRLNRAFSPS